MVRIIIAIALVIGGFTLIVTGAERISLAMLLAGVGCAIVGVTLLMRK